MLIVILILGFVVACITAATMRSLFYERMRLYEKIIEQALAAYAVGNDQDDILMTLFEHYDRIHEI